MSISVLYRSFISILLSVFTLLSVELGGVSLPGFGRRAVPTGLLEQAEEMPEAPAQEEELVRVSEKLAMPRIAAPAEADEILLDLNSVLVEGYAAKSLVADAFAEVFGKVIIFRAGEDRRTAYVLGEPVAIPEGMRRRRTAILSRAP